MEKFGLYNFKILKHPKNNKWIYRIIKDDENLWVYSTETFEYEGVARFAAIGHISLLEQGKG